MIYSAEVKFNIHIVNEIRHLQKVGISNARQKVEYMYNVMPTNLYSCLNTSRVYMPSTKLNGLLLLSLQSNVHSTSSISLIPTETNQYLQTVPYWALQRWKST